VYLFLTPLGYAMTDDEFKIVEKILFPKIPSEVAKEYLMIEKKQASDTLNKLLQRVSRKEIKVINSNLFEILKEKKMNVYLVERVDKILVKLKEIQNDLVKEIFGLEKEYINFLKETLTELARLKIREEQQNKDKIIIQTIESIDELDKVINILVSRLNEWYGLYFPELYKILNDNEQFARIVSKIPFKEEMSEENLKAFGIGEEKIKKIIDASKTSIGADLPEEDILKIRNLAILVKDMYERRKELENYLEELMKEVAPNIYAITGATIGARIITKAAGLKRLSELPASTIQVLGAEKALFKHLKYGAKPPKHGILFQHPLVHSAPKAHRGKIARLLANKIALAARLDYYGQREMGELLRKEIMSKVEEIKKLPPKKKVKKR